MRSMYGQVVRRVALQDKAILTRMGWSSEPKRTNLLCGWSAMASREGDDP